MKTNTICGLLYMSALMLSGTALFAQNPVKPEGIVVTFENPSSVDNYFYFTKTNWNRNDYLISIFADQTKEQLENKPNEITKPVIRSFKQNYLVLRHKVNYFDESDYLLKQGDSVLIRYSNGKPVVTFLNREVLPYDAGVEDLVRQQQTGDKFSALSNYFGARVLNGKRILSDKSLSEQNNRLSKKDRQEKITREVSELKQKLYPGAKLYLQTENRILDSLKAAGEISPDVYAYQKDKAKFMGYLTDMENGVLDISQIASILHQYQPNTFGYPEPFYDQFIEAVGDKFISYPAPYFETSDGTNRDARKVFTALDSTDLFPARAKNHLLTRQLNRIHHNFSQKDFFSYYMKFQSSVKDSAYLSSVSAHFALEFDKSRNETKTMILSDLKGTRFSFENLIDKHRGKVIYVDFWASWCGPCRQAMPASASLRTKLDNKQIVFIYLSIDATAKPWQAASTKEKLDIYEENYLIVNYKTADFLKQQKLTSIPRYMIFDKTGKLTHPNAPRVEQETAGLLLSELAGKQ